MRSRFCKFPIQFNIQFTIEFEQEQEIPFLLQIPSTQRKRPLVSTLNGDSFTSWKYKISLIRILIYLRGWGRGGGGGGGYLQYRWRGGPTYIFGLKIYTLGIFCVKSRKFWRQVFFGCTISGSCSFSDRQYEAPSDTPDCCKYKSLFMCRYLPAGVKNTPTNFGKQKRILKLRY